MKSRSLFSPYAVGWVAVYGLLMGALYLPTATYLVSRWGDEDYNYCYLIPVVVLYLLWEKRQEFASTPAVPSWGGLGVVGCGLGLFWLGELGGEYFLQYLSLWLLIIGLFWVQGGVRKLRTIGFPLAMIPTMFPLPHFLNSKVTLGLQLLSTRFGVAALELAGVSAHREGNVVDLGFTQLQVVEACSGLRYVFPFLIVGLLLSYIFRGRWWNAAVLAASGVATAIVANSGRIALTGYLYKYWGPGAAEGFFHDFTGWFVFMFGLAVLIPEAFVLRRLSRSGRLTAGGRGKEALLVTPVAASAPRGVPRAALVAMLLIAATLAASRGVQFREKMPLRQPLAELPLQLGPWTGTPQTMDRIFIDTLRFSDYALIDYRRGSGAPVNFYVAYYETQRKGVSIHSPDTCLPGGGWIFEDSGVVTLPAPGVPGGAMQVKRAFMRKVGEQELAYYWFPQRGRVLTSPYQLKLYAFWDALLHHRTDGALVRLVTPVLSSESVADADSRLQDFLRVVAPVLETRLPGRS